MQVVRERTINGHKISDLVHFVMATNGANDKAAVTGILRPLANRCVAVTVEADVDAFAEWLAENHGDVPVLEAFIRHRPGHLLGEHLDADQVAGRIGAGYPTPRSITMVGDILRAGHDLDVMEALCVGTVGKPFTSEFIGYAKVYKSVTKYGEIISDPMNAKLPQTIDARYAQCGSICQRAKRGDMDPIAKFVARIGGDYESYFWALIEKARKDLVETKAYQEWRMQQNY